MTATPDWPGEVRALLALIKESRFYEDRARKADSPVKREHELTMARDAANNVQKQLDKLERMVGGAS